MILLQYIRLPLIRPMLPRKRKGSSEKIETIAIINKIYIHQKFSLWWCTFNVCKIINIYRTWFILLPAPAAAQRVTEESVTPNIVPQELIHFVLWSAVVVVVPKKEHRLLIIPLFITLSNTSLNNIKKN